LGSTSDGVGTLIGLDVAKRAGAGGVGAVELALAGTAKEAAARGFPGVVDGCDDTTESVAGACAEGRCVPGNNRYSPSNKAAPTARPHPPLEVP